MLEIIHFIQSSESSGQNKNSAATRMSENMYEKGATKTLKSLSVKCNYLLYKLTCVKIKTTKC